MVAHELHHILHLQFLVGLDPEGEAVVEVVAAGIILILSHLSRAATIESHPHAGFAEAGGLEVNGGVGIAEAELGVVGIFRIVAFQFGESNHIVGIDRADVGQENLVDFLVGDGSLAVAEREGGDTRLVGVAGDVAVGNAAGHPHGTVGPAFHGLALCILHLLAFSNQLKNPSLVGVGDGERLAFAAVAISIQQFADDLDGFAGGLGTLQGDVDEGAVVDEAGSFPEFGTATVGGFTDHELMLVHVANDRIGVGHFWNLAEFLARVPLNDITERAGRMVGGRHEIEFTIEGVRVGGIGNHTTAGSAGTLGDDKIRTSGHP